MIPRKGFGFIEYRTSHQAKKALNLLNGRLFMKKSLHVDYNRSETPQQLIYTSKQRGHDYGPRGPHYDSRGHDNDSRGHHYDSRGSYKGIFSHGPRDTPTECRDDSEEYPEKPSGKKNKKAVQKKKGKSSNSNEVSFEFGSCVSLGET